MTQKRIFFLSSGRLTVYEWSAGRFLEQPIAFAADADGLTRFSDYLASTEPTPVSLLVDLVEEEFREETVPHVMGADRQAMIRTKQTRLFRDPTYSHAMLQGRESEGRRDDRVLFTALIRPELLSPWLGQISRRKVPLEGIYSLPVFSQSLLKRIPVAAEHALLVTLHTNGGLRQTFFHQGQLKVSRLASVPRLEPGQYAGYVLGEVERIRRYLNSLRLLSRESPLDVYLLTHGGVLTDLRRLASDSVTTRHHLLDLAEVAVRLRLKDPIETAYADTLFAHLLARFPPKNHYGRPQETRYFDLHRIRVGMAVASALMLLFGVTWSGFTFVDGVLAKQEAQMVDRQIGFYDDRYRIARARLPELPADAEEMKKAVETAGVLESYRSTPFDLLRVLGERLEVFPGLYIESIDWRVGATLVSEDPQRGRRGRRPAPPDGSFYQLAEIRGRVKPFDGDFRRAMETVNRFADTLTGVPNMARVRVIALPLDVSSGGRLQGTEEGAGDVAEFALEIALRTHDGESS